jgi:hypothetical protein
MHNGVDFPKGRVDEALIKEVTEDVDLPEGVPLYLFVGRMMWYKGIRIILDALNMLKTSGRDFRMVFIGGGGDKNEIMLYADSLKLGDKVFFQDPIGDRNALRAWYCRADLFLFPSTFDTNGLVVREAAACALPSVLVKGSCAAEDTDDLRNAFWIDENAKSLCAFLLRFGDDFDVMERVGRNAQEELYLSWEDAVKTAYDRYQVVIENYRSGGYKKRDRISDQFFMASAEAINNLLGIENTRTRVIEQAKANIKEIQASIEGFEGTIAKSFEKIKYINSQLGSEMKAKYRESREAILKEFDRYK